MKFPTIEIVDRYAIAQVKYIKTNGENQEELTFYTEQMNEIGLDVSNELVLKLVDHHAEVWALEDDFKKGRVDSKPLEEIGRMAIAVRDKGYERKQIKNALAELLNDPVREVKRDHSSE